MPVAAELAAMLAAVFAAVLSAALLEPVNPPSCTLMLSNQGPVVTAFATLLHSALGDTR